MKNHHEVGHFKNRLMMVLLSLFAILVMAGQSFAATTCSSCHEMPPLDSVDGSRQPSTGAFKGSHQKHMGAVATPDECTKCHGNSGYTSDHSKTSGNMIQMNPNINNSISGTYDKPAPFAQSSAPEMATCSNVNCHFEKNTTTRPSAPVWGNTIPAVDCNFCHASQPATANHSKHLAAVAYGATMTCASCHPNYGTTSFSHATSAGKHPIVVNTNNNYGGAGVTSTSWLPSQPDTYGSCSTYCHSNGNIPSGYRPTTWGGASSTGCNFCHPNLSLGHSTHIGSLLTEITFYNYTSTSSSGTGYKFGCANCHPINVANHINGSVEVDLTQSASGGHLKALNGAWTYTASQCNNVYCHSNGYKPGATYTFATTPAWGSSFAGDRCAACHGNSPNSTIVGSSAHTAHVVGIHVDDIFNGVSRKLPIGGGNAVNAAHGRNNRSTTINCNICHNATITSSANDKNFYCSGCHDGSTPPGGFQNIADPLNINALSHVNGKVDVSFINKKIATKAQLAITAFAGYTAANAGGWSRNSNNMKFKTYTSSYDVSKSTLFSSASWSQVAGCENVACHNGKTVMWTDTVGCTSCHTRLK